MSEIKIGIIAAPEFSTDVANQLIEELPQIFNQEISPSVPWKIEIMIDGITSVAEDSEELLDGVLTRQKDKGWDYTLCLTDIPIFYDDEITVARVNFDYSTALLSLPALGWRLNKRVPKMALQVVEDIYYENSSATTIDRNDRTKSIFLLNKIKRIETNKNGEKVTRYLFHPKFNGRLTILSGMTYDNKPWTIMPSLKSVFAVAFGSGAYALIFPTIWQIGYSYSSWRLATLMILAIVILTLWIIQAHKLWEKQSSSRDSKYRIFYNAATVTTLLLAVSFFYLFLVLIFLITSLIFVEPSFYVEQLGLSEPPNLLSYLQLAWITASVGTLTGAVGVGLEDEKNVRYTTYGYRQRERYAVFEEDYQEEEVDSE